MFRNKDNQDYICSTPKKGLYVWLVLNMQYIECADFVIRCLNKHTPTDVFHDHFEKLDHQKVTGGNSRTLILIMFKTRVTFFEMRKTQKRGFS